MSSLAPTPMEHARRQRALLPLLSLLSLCALSMGARGCERAVVGDECTDAGSDAECTRICRYDGQRFASGDTFPSSDGCNSCSCGDDGEVVCTKRACTSGTCQWQGTRLNTGDGFTHPDGCNECSCQADGSVVCTQRDCAQARCEYAGKRYRVGQSFPASDGCNTCSCQADGVACTEKACGGNSSSRVMCGGLLGRGCPDGQYCNYPPDASCGAADATGVCEAIPDACDLLLHPVCGCDDETYPNACQAAMAGVSVARDGECGSEPGNASCGGLAGRACPAGQYCMYPPDASCGAADATGQCARIPDVCPEIFARVCGCDDQTYGNACEAAKAGVSVLHERECDIDSTAAACGGLRGLTCPDGQYCNYPRDALCGAADATGVCTARPNACTRQYEPVCGCDGETYGNACTAASEGVSVTSDGPCS